MKAGWEVKTLGSLLEVKNGYAFDSKKFTPDAGTPLIRIRDIKEGKGTAINYNGEYNEEFICKQGDFLIGMDGEFGCYEWKGDPSLLNQRVCRLENFDSGLMSRFLFYGINKYLKEIEAVTGYTTVKHLSSKTIKTIEFPLPPLEEQKRIVSILDEAFEGLDRARENAEANLKSARELFDNQISTLFSELCDGFGSKKIGEIADHRLGKMLDKNKNKGEPRKYLRNTNVQWFEISTSNLLEMRIEDDEISKYSAQKGDLLICEGGYPGRAAIWIEDEPIFFQKALHRVRFAEPIYNELLLYWLYLSDKLGLLAKYCTGTGILHFTGKSLARFEMPFPPKDDALKAVNFIVETKQHSEELQAHYATKLQDISDLRQSLLQKAFAGELT